ncbi:MAG: hypothetical protein HRT71_18375 [Flavobacteriales bacterium]|nr:hypothetical protein [Flavobacteriales bacterium]
MRINDKKNTCTTCGQTTPIKPQLVTVELTPEMAVAIEFIKFQEAGALPNALKKIHDLALYYTNEPLSQDEIWALYLVELLREKLSS